MADYSDMPPLMPAGYEDNNTYDPSPRPMLLAPYMGGIPPPPAQNVPHWGAFLPPPVASPNPWPSAGTPMGWPTGGTYFSSPTLCPPVNPAMGVVGGEQWPVGDVINFGQNDGDRRMIGDSFPTRRPSQRSATPHSSSINSSPSSGSSNLSRKQSLHGPDGEASKRPPREWRTDFSMTKPGMFGLGALFRSRSRSISSGHEAKNGAKPKLHPYLRFNSSNPNMHLDLRRSPNELRFRVVSRPINQWDMMRFACEPAQPHMRLYNAHFPWFIDVDSANPTGVTLFELFTAINVAMMTQISHADYWNTELDGQARERIAHAWSERCEDDEELRRGVKRVDFLMHRVILEGLAKGKDGMWEMKLSKL